MQNKKIGKGLVEEYDRQDADRSRARINSFQIRQLTDKEAELLRIKGWVSIPDMIKSYIHLEIRQGRLKGNNNGE